LFAGEPGVELDTGKVKIGDGVQAWSNLPYFLDEEDVAVLIAQMIEAAVLEGVPGPAGKSAYQVAVDNGFVGTEPQWLASLVGPQGDPGPPGADGDDGAPGTPGADGSDGAPGLSAYQVAVSNGFVGTESAWLASLVGADGTPGTDGQDGADGESVTVTLVPEASWPPAADANPLHLYFRVPDA
jgi:hypothetical protein